MAAIKVENPLSGLRTLFNKMDEVYYKKGELKTTDLSSELTVDFELPVLSDGVSFDTGAAEVTEVKLTTDSTWTSRSEKADSDISFQIASVESKVNELFMDKVLDIEGATNLGDGNYSGAAYSLAPKKATGSFILASQDKQTFIILPNVEMYASLVLADGENPAYYNAVLKLIQNSEGADIFILEKGSSEIE